MRFVSMRHRIEFESLSIEMGECKCRLMYSSKNEIILNSHS